MFLISMRTPANHRGFLFDAVVGLRRGNAREADQQLK